MMLKIIKTLLNYFKQRLKPAFYNKIQLLHKTYQGWPEVLFDKNFFKKTFVFFSFRQTAVRLHPIAPFWGS